MKLPKIIYIMGPPGAGKGTQAEILAQWTRYKRFSTGDAFRKITREDSELGRRVKETIDNGYLATPEMAAEVVTAAVAEHIEAGHGLIFDGSPRTVKEAQMIDEFFEAKGYGRPLAILLQVDKDEMMRRNSRRKFCLGIDGDFPVVTDHDADRCVDLGGYVGIRPDDDPEKFATRWSQFMENTAPVIEAYRKEGILKEVNGAGTVDTVAALVNKVVRQYELP